MYEEEQTKSLMQQEQWRRKRRRKVLTLKRNFLLHFQVSLFIVLLMYVVVGAVRDDDGVLWSHVSTNKWISHAFHFFLSPPSSSSYHIIATSFLLPFVVLFYNFHAVSKILTCDDTCHILFVFFFLSRLIFLTLFHRDFTFMLRHSNPT